VGRTVDKAFFGGQKIESRGCKDGSQSSPTLQNRLGAFLKKIKKK
jgi:hypothetical protein